MDEIKVGVVYPQIELGGDPAAVKRIGRATEDLGFDYLLAYDHVLGAVHEGREPPLLGPYTEHDPFHDPLVMFAYLAGITERIGFATGILILPQRQTVLVARQAADLDLFSGGRLRLGVGIGWNHVEYDALGQDFSTRGRREEEQIDLLRRLWSDDVVTFEGQFDRVDRAALVPPPQRRIPIWLGGFGEAAFARAARVGDGFMFGGGTAQVFDSWKRVKELLGEGGRSVEGFGAESFVRTDKGPEAAVDRMHEWRDAGGTHASVVTMGHGFTTVDEHVDYLVRVATALQR